MMELTGRDMLYSTILHLALIAAVLVVKPFSIKIRPHMEAMAVNIITLPPLGNPDLLKGSNLKIIVPQATKKDESAVPLKTPESKDKKAEKKKETARAKPKKDAGYTGRPTPGDQTQSGGTDISDKLGPGSPFGTVSVDNAGFDYPVYFVQAFGKIQRNWSNPVAANEPLSCIINFQIIRSGTILEPTIEKSSGIAAFDRACLRAVQASDPLPPLPVDFREDIIGIHLEFPYQP